MRRILTALIFSLWSSMASATITCTLPFTLTNGTTADATQVMANYNALVACFVGAAASGANTDITSLLGLTTPLAPASGGTAWFLGGTSTGSGNAQAVASLTPNSFNLTARTFVAFTAGFTNTGATTFAVNGTTATAVLNRTPTGLVALSGGEIVAGQVTIGYYDGTQYELIDATPNNVVQPCTEISYQGVSTPSGYLAENGQAVSRTTYANLFSCMAVTGVAATLNGTTTVTVPNSALFQVGWYVGGNNITCNSTISSIPGGGTTIVLNNAAGASGSSTLTIGPQPQGDCSTTFNLPNANGREAVGIDTGGSTLSSTACPNPASLGSKCGSTTQTIGLTNLPTGITSANNSQNITVAGTNNALYGGSNLGSLSAGGTIEGPAPGSGTSYSTGLPSSGSNAISVTSNNTGGTPFLLQPVYLVLKAIKF